MLKPHFAIFLIHLFFIHLFIVISFVISYTAKEKHLLQKEKKARCPLSK